MSDLCRKCREELPECECYRTAGEMAMSAGYDQFRSAIPQFAEGIRNAPEKPGTMFTDAQWRELLLLLRGFTATQPVKAPVTPADALLNLRHIQALYKDIARGRFDDAIKLKQYKEWLHSNRDLLQAIADLEEPTEAVTP